MIAILNDLVATLYGIEPYVPIFSRLCEAVAARVGEHIGAGAIATARTGGALDLYYDEADLTILQIAGSKRWIIHGAPLMPRPTPTPERGLSAD